MILKHHGRDSQHNMMLAQSQGATRSKIDNFRIFLIIKTKFVNILLHIHQKDAFAINYSFKLKSDKLSYLKVMHNKHVSSDS